MTRLALRAPRARGLVTALALAALAACDRGGESAPPTQTTRPQATAPAPSAPAAAAAPAPDRAALLQRAQAVFKPAPTEVPNPANPITDEKIRLGRMLFYDPRLSKAQE